MRPAHTQSSLPLCLNGTGLGVWSTYAEPTLQALVAPPG